MRLLNVEQLRTLVPVSRTKLNMMIDRGEFIQPVQVAGQLMFDEAEVKAWIDRQPRGLYQQKPALRRHQKLKAVP
jgi:predicted DNA-binding transcriptional regulator AlpA